MEFIDNITEELYKYRPSLTNRDDFDEFWERTISESKAVPLESESILYDYPSPFVEVYDITYNGFDGTLIHGWYMCPKFIDRSNLPCIVHYHGYGGNRGRPADFMQWVMMGFAVISIDCRDQNGDTGNRAIYSSGSTQSAVCKGILDKDEYYFRAVYMDCMRAIDFAYTREEIDKDRIIVEGGSQGGALAMAVAALDHRVYASLADVPSNSNIEKRIEGSYGSFSSVTGYLKVHPDKIEKVYETLSYFDTMNMADKIDCPVLASVGLQDNICPAKLYFATYNRIRGEKRVEIYPFNGHEGGGAIHNEIKLRYVMEII